MAMTFVRGKVSKNKRRYVDKKNGFDLDLAYVTPNIIAMGFPSEGVEGAYRNPYSEVLRFLDLRHQNKYKVYNLCSERTYEASKFYNRVSCFPFDDHNAPPFELIQQFSVDVKEFLDKDPENVAVVHCKAGKGRTGLMICAYLLYSEEWGNATEAMDFYAAMRTRNKKGVTIPSQIRYIEYFERSLKSGVPAYKTLRLKQVVTHGCPRLGKAAELRYAVVTDKKAVVYSGKCSLKSSKKTNSGDDDDSALYEFDMGNVAITGDAKVEFNEPGAKKGPLFQFWFNTAFVDNGYMLVTKNQIDKANKDKNHKTFPKDFQIEAFFESLENEAPKEESPTVSLAVAASSPKTKDSAKTLPPLIYSDFVRRYATLINT